MKALPDMDKRGFSTWLRKLFGRRPEHGLIDAAESEPETAPEERSQMIGPNLADGYQSPLASSVPPLKLQKQPRPSTPGTFAEANNEFAVSLYGSLRQRQANMVFSPFSIRTALGMSLVGARADTATQMGEVLRFAAGDESSHTILGEFLRWLNAGGGGLYEMSVANSLWTQDGTPLQAEFLELIGRYYGGEMNPVDFRSAAEAARGTINAWVDDKTKQKIRDLIPPGSLNADTRLVLANAVYFKGIWESEFDEWGTSDATFYLAGGGTVQAPLMNQTAKFRHMRADGYQAVDLAYKGDNLSMLVLLPDQVDGIAELEDRLSLQLLSNCDAQLREREVQLSLPCFRITWGSVDLSVPLGALGMTLAFNPLRADFSGMNGHRPPSEEALFISSVLHKAFVEVNEKGTEAAASTAVCMTLLGELRPPPTPIFRADHPFIFAIRDRSGAILFLGRVADPTIEG